jgi:hypothetical protein
MVENFLTWARPWVQFLDIKEFKKLHRVMRNPLGMMEVSDYLIVGGSHEYVSICQSSSNYILAVFCFLR